MNDREDYNTSMAKLFCISLLLWATGGFCSAVSDQFQLEPLAVTALQGSDVRFNATMQGKWTYMTWQVQGLLVLTVPVTNNITSSEQYSATFCTSGDTSCVVFTIRNITRRDSGPVVCFVQGDYGSKTAELLVQESGAVNIMEGNVTVEQDQQVEFQCVTTAWFPIPTVTWTRNGQTVNSSLYNTTSEVHGDSFNSTSVLTFQAVSNTTVECLATVSTLTNPKSSSVHVTVVPKPPDWTVLIAVVVSIGGVVLLVLLILGIIFCCKRRKRNQLNYKDEMRRMRTQSPESSGVSPAGHKQGQVNAGYVTTDQTSVAPSEFTVSGFVQANGSSKMPDVVNSQHTGNGYNSVEESGFRKHRHVTIV
ncbi:hypothetical protein PAMA_006453 [Pampus argenteus]